MHLAAVLGNLYPFFRFLFLPTARGQLGILHSPPPTERKVLPAPKSSRLPLIPRRQAGACRQRRTRRQKTHRHQHREALSGHSQALRMGLHLWLPSLLGQPLPFKRLGAVAFLLPGGISPALRTWGSHCCHLLQFGRRGAQVPEVQTNRFTFSKPLFLCKCVSVSPLLSLPSSPFFLSLSRSLAPDPIFHFFSLSYLIFHFMYSLALYSRAA